MHIVDDVHGIDINVGEPVHHTFEIVDNIVKVKVFSLDRSPGRSDLVASDFIPATVDCIKQAFGEIRTGAEKLHLFFENGRFLVIESAEGLAGCVYAEVRGSRGYIGLLALRPELKGRGLGRVLMSHAEEYLGGAGCEAADLRTISARTDLVPMYRHLGYREMGTAAMPPEIPLKVPCHFIVMSKQLQKPEQSAP